MTVEELRSRMPDVLFIKTKKYIDTPDQLIEENFIRENDTPPFTQNDRLRVMPLSVTTYPGVLRRMTAMQAGAWAVTKCLSQNWQPSKDNIESCLANLEMDF